MKTKYLSLFILALLSGMFVACGSNESGQTEEAPEEAVEEAVEEQEDAGEAARMLSAAEAAGRVMRNGRRHMISMLQPVRKRKCRTGPF